MSEDTPKCAKLHHLKNSSRGNMPLYPLAMCSKTRSLNMKLCSCPRVIIYELDISVQAM